ncbi:DUF3892 domain-containing protein [Parvibaculum sp.]|uniref:DUF3892 domain-containing protein n=1 Tax=Parvibaculum sp. TaxID=2024848 RepID=UPI0038B23751
MTQTAEVSCINKNDRYSPYERIERIGGRAGGGWTLPLDDAIRKIESKDWAFYVSRNGQTVWIVVATNNGRKYLKTEADGAEPNNLLSLPECPR